MLSNKHEKMPFAFKLFNNKLFYFKNERTKDLLNTCFFYLEIFPAHLLNICTYTHDSYTLP